MYTTTIGRIFLNVYNERYQTNYTPEEFFTQCFVPLFFDHQKYLMTGGNAPFENPPISWGDMLQDKKPYESFEKRKERIDKTIQRMKNDALDASIARGYPVTLGSSPTLAQVTTMPLPNCPNDAFLSWIGDALAVGVKGGVVIAFDDNEILLDLFEGWKFYRDYLDKNPLMKGNQINTWNGVWLSYYYGPYYEERIPVNSQQLIKTNDSVISLDTVYWTNVLSKIATRRKKDTLMGYIYSIGKSNSTYGFIPFYLKEINRPYALYKKLFGENELLKDLKKMNELYGTGIVFKEACQMGCIGVRAMKPRGLQKYMEEVNKRTNIKKENNDETILTFNIYITWIMAVLNNADLWAQTELIIHALLAYLKEAQKLRSDRKNNVEQLLASKTPEVFLRNLIPVIENEKANDKEITVYENLINLIITMPRDNFSFFNTLLSVRFALMD